VLVTSVSYASLLTQHPLTLFSGNAPEMKAMLKLASEKNIKPDIEVSASGNI